MDILSYATSGWTAEIPRRAGHPPYLGGQTLGRLATVDGRGRPRVTPVGFRVNTERGTIAIGGIHMATTGKYKNLKVNPNVAFVVDDIASVKPWVVRGIEIRGTAETHETGGSWIEPRFDEAWIEITPRRVDSWGLGIPSGRG